MNKYEEAMKHLDEKLGHKDGLISLSTIALEPGANGRSRPAARLVDAYYEDGAFYIVTYATSDKMLQIAQIPKWPFASLSKTSRLTVSVKTWDGCATRRMWR